jgi:quinoprotein glucose dehydrogenase
MRFPRLLFLILSIALPSLFLFAQSHALPLTQKEPPDGTEAAAKQATGFRLPPGLKAELWAAEPKLMNPVAFCLDEKGRVFVAEEFRLNRGTEENRGRSFLLDDDLQLKTIEDRLKMYEKHAAKFGGMDYFRKYTDQVRLLEDTTGSGRADKSTVFATGFNDPLDGLAAGIMAWNGNVYLTEIPNLWRLQDTKGTGTADVREKLLTGFGVSCAFLGHDLHGLTVGPDGKLYFSIGDRGYNVTNKEGKNFTGLRTGAVFRCDFDGSNFEVVHKGLRNPQELAFDQYGNLFADDNNCDKGDHARLVYICEGGDSGWNMAFQTIPEPYMAGPWFAERMWHLPHEGQPAWLLPCVGKIGTGPGGFAFSSGVGLPDRYKNSFLMANYAGGFGGIEAFKVKPKGAGFEIEDYHDFLKPLMPTDVEIGYDGKVYVSEFGPLKWDGSNNQGRIYTVFDPNKQADADVVGMKKLFAEGFEKLDAKKLTELLEHPDMRVRLRSQLELEKKDPARLPKVAKESKHQLARIHAIWGMGNLAAKKPELAKDLVPLLSNEDDGEIVAQVLKALGRSQAKELAPHLKASLLSGLPRHRYFAAETLGKWKYTPAVEWIFETLAVTENDPWLRHSLVTALARIDDKDAILKRSADPNPRVRLGALLALRQMADARVSQFLNDSDLFIRTEAARAVHDLPIEGLYPALAEVLTKLPAGLTQEADPLLRRAIHAAYRLGTKEQAERILKVAANPNASLAIRSEALACLRDWNEPGPRDRVTGFWRPLDKRDPAVIKGVVEAGRETLLSLNSQKLQIEAIAALVKAGAKVDDELFRGWIVDPTKQTALRVAALRSLASRKSSVLKDVLQTSLKDTAPLLRATARELLAQSDPAAGTAELLAVLLRKDAALVEQQSAILTLPKMKSPQAGEALDGLARRLCDADFPREWIVDTLEALKAAPTPTRETLRKNYEDPLPKDPVGKYQMSLFGGDGEKGRELFYNHTGAQCVRCHKVKDAGGVAGPDLTEVAKRYPERTRDHLLESLVLPSAKIAPGFGTATFSLDDGRVLTGVVLEDTQAVKIQLPDGKQVAFPADAIEKRTPMQSPMPTVDRTLTPREMRDLIEFLSTLK